MCLAIPGRIVEFLDEEEFASVEVSGVRRMVNVALLKEDGLAQDDWVLIHVGFAMSRISAEQAQEQIHLLETLGEAQAAFEEVQGYGSEIDPFEGSPFSDDSAVDDGSYQQKAREEQ